MIYVPIRLTGLLLRTVFGHLFGRVCLFFCLNFFNFFKGGSIGIWVLKFGKCLKDFFSLSS